MIDRAGQTWSIATGEVGRTLTFVVLEKGEQPEQGKDFWRALLLLDTCPNDGRRFPDGCVLKVEDGAWERMGGTHARLG